jgi:transposase-like protein
MTNPSPFKWRHFEPESLLCGVRWYLRYALSSRDGEALMLERGLRVDPPTGFRGVQRYAPELGHCQVNTKIPNKLVKPLTFDLINR